MQSKRVRVAFDQAVAALAGVTSGELRRLTVAEAALVLYAAPNVPRLKTLRAQLAGRLRAQLNVTWVEQGNADEVFLVLAALWQYEPAMVTGEHLAASLQRLITAELIAGGPYHFKHDTVAANVHIAAFTRLVARPLPNVESFLTRVMNGQFADMRLDDIRHIFVLAHAAPNPKLQAYVKQQLDGFWRGTAEDPHIVTTAIIASVLARYQPPDAQITALHAQQNSIAQAARQMFADHSEPLKSTGQSAVAKVMTADTNFEITLLPQLFAQALKTNSTTPEHHTKLGLASLYGWIAYTIYDDFLDAEGHPATLPVANVAMRASLNCFRAALPDNESFMRYVAKTFTTMDEANAWEVHHCRFTVNTGVITISQLPQYKSRATLAARSQAHMLAPLAVLELCQANKHRARFVETAFTHYLIARQLSDDLQDWPDDIQRGQISYVVAAILRDARIQPGAHTLTELLPLMQKTFRRSTLPRICACILQHTARSRAAFNKSQLLRHDGEFYNLINRIDQTARQSLDTLAKTEAFYNASKRLI